MRKNCLGRLPEVNNQSSITTGSHKQSTYIRKTNVQRDHNLNKIDRILEHCYRQLQKHYTWVQAYVILKGHILRKPNTIIMYPDQQHDQFSYNC